MFCRLLVLLLLPVILHAQGVITTIAGNGTSSSSGPDGDGGLATSATLLANSMAMDRFGNIAGAVHSIKR